MFGRQRKGEDSKDFVLDIIHHPIFLSHILIFYFIVIKRIQKELCDSLNAYLKADFLLFIISFMCSYNCVSFMALLIAYHIFIMTSIEEP